MTGFPYALWKEDEYRADRISINLDTDEVILEGKVQGFISTVQEDNNGKNTEEDTSGGETNEDPNETSGGETNEDTSLILLHLYPNLY
jgi:lipopolysaccharide export system protein LptA